MIYHMWTPGDALLEEIPENCEQLHPKDGWMPCINKAQNWQEITYRWPAEPQEQRPTAFGLLSTEEQEELEEARDAGEKFQYLGDAGGWCNTETPLVNTGWIYRIKPETLNFRLTLNGKEVSPKDISKETWMSFRGEQE